MRRPRFECPECVETRLVEDTIRSLVERVTSASRQVGAGHPHRRLPRPERCANGQSDLRQGRYRCRACGRLAWQGGDATVTWYHDGPDCREASRHLLCGRPLRDDYGGCRSGLAEYRDESRSVSADKNNYSLRPQINGVADAGPTDENTIAGQDRKERGYRLRNKRSLSRMNMRSLCLPRGPRKEKSLPGLWCTALDRADSRTVYEETRFILRGAHRRRAMANWTP